MLGTNPINTVQKTRNTSPPNSVKLRNMKNTKMARNF
jgi:hypothetical protein